MVHGSDVEEMSGEEEEEDDLAELIGEDSYVDGRRNYATRRKAQLRRARAGEPISEPVGKAKRSRIIRMEDSSDEEQGEGGITVRAQRRAAQSSPEAAKQTEQLPVFKTPLLPPQSSSTVGKSVSHGPTPQLNHLEDRNHQRLQNQARLSEELDFEVMPSTTSV